MHKRNLFISASLSGLMILSALPCLAQGAFTSTQDLFSVSGGQPKNALNSTANYGTQGGWGHSSFRGTESVWDYQHRAAPGQMQLENQGKSDYTNNNGAWSDYSPNGPDLRGSPSSAQLGPQGQSGAATSAPFQGTYAAPTNFALRNEGRQTLPPTRLTSIIRDGGMSDTTYGDEGTSGPPPYSNFSTIESTGGVSGLTTGHPSDAPSAWGTPQ